jgi:hypothetical protein
MREHTIIMPRDAGFACEWLRSRFLDAFGGYTEHEATGAWKDPTGAVIYDHNSVFTVAAGDRDDLMRSIAKMAGRIGEQQSVYYRDPLGDVHFIDTAEVR